MAAVLLLAAVLRLALLACACNHPAAVATPDTRDYVTLSDSLLGGQFARDGSPEIFRTPGYPLILLLGTAVDAANWWHLILIVQIAADLLLVYLTYLLGCLLLGAAAGRWAAFFQATSAVAVVSSLRILTDGLFAMLLALGLLLLVHHWRQRRTWSLAASAAVLAAACYVRPVGQAFVAAVAAALAVRALWPQPANRAQGRGAPTRRRLLASVVLYVALAAAVLSPWIIRNAHRADYRGFSSFAADSVYYFAVPEVIVRRSAEFGLPRDVGPEQARRYVRELDRQDAAVHPGRTPGQGVRFRQAYSLKVIARHPWLYLRLHISGMKGFFLPGATDVLEVAGLTRGNRGTSDVLRSQGAWAALKHYFGSNEMLWRDLAAAAGLSFAILVMTAAQYLGVALFLVRSLRRKLPGEMWVLLALAAMAPLLCGPFAFPRYQTMVVPLLSLFAAAGYCWRRPEVLSAPE